MTQMTLNATSQAEGTHICWTTVHKPQISLRFALRAFFFQIIEVLVSPIGYEIGIFEKKSKIQNFKNTQCKFVKIIGRKI